MDSVPQCPEAIATEETADYWITTDAAIDALIADPRFDDVMFAMAASLVAHYRGNWLLNRIGNDRGRVMAAFTMLDLHFHGGGRGFSVAQLREQAQLYRICSPNRITAFAALLRATGYLRPGPPLDGRQRQLAPTETFIAMQRARLQGMLQPQAVIRPELHPAIEALGSDPFLGEVVHYFLAYWRSGYRATRGHPALESLIERDAAFTLLFMVMIGERQGKSFRIAEIARRFAVSRSHAASVLVEAASHAFVSQTEPGGPYRATPALLVAMRPFFAQIILVQGEALTLAFSRHHQARDHPLTPLPG